MTSKPKIEKDKKKSIVSYLIYKFLWKLEKDKIKLNPNAITFDAFDE